MPLPANGAAWPPPHMAEAYRHMRRDDMWYRGDPDELMRAHEWGERHPQMRGDDRRRRFGRRTDEAAYPSKREQRLHVPLAGDIASTSADLLFGDMPAIRCATTGTQDRLDAILDEARVQHLLLSAAEQSAAISGVYLRATWDRDTIPDRPIPDVVQADQAVPEFRWGMLRSVIFWRALPGDGSQTVHRHLELHEPGRISHALYEGTPDNLGRAVPLTEHADTAALVPSLGPDGVSIDTGIQRLTAVYVPNMLPNRLHRGSPMGRSDYAAPIYDLFGALDDTWTSWMRDLRLARSRLVVPEAYLQNMGPGRGAAFDDEREIYSGLKIPPTEGNAGGITIAQFEIRVAEHSQTVDSAIRQAARSAGYSARSFGLATDGAAVTATEVDSEDQRTKTTTKKKAGYWRYAVADFCEVLLDLDRAQFNRAVKVERPTVTFQPVAESPLSKATTIEMLNRAQAVSTETKVRMRSPELDDAEVQAEVARILDETGQAAPDPGGTFPM
ncbi:phage capsid protein [Streptomyces sp. NPDC058783]|uniref:phage capsid protein n=1 Tax=Streptomyces sp. NPDC058783 TaxID=3346633 RepID=UPI0036B02FB2